MLRVRGGLLMASEKSSRSGSGGKRPTGNGQKQPAVAAFTRAERLDAYKQMLLIRRFEEKAGQLYGMGHIGGFCHLYIGQEAVVVGLQMALEPGDQVITAYRDHGHTLAAGMDAKSVMAELTGRRHGCSTSSPTFRTPAALRSLPRGGAPSWSWPGALTCW